MTEAQLLKLAYRPLVRRDRRWNGCGYGEANGYEDTPDMGSERKE